MKFLSTPNHAVTTKNHRSGRVTKLFSFDANGEFETEDARLIAKLTPVFKREETAAIRCKKCEFETQNRGDLLAHYRKEHPKEN